MRMLVQPFIKQLHQAEKYMLLNLNKRKKYLFLKLEKSIALLRNFFFLLNRNECDLNDCMQLIKKCNSSGFI